MSRTPISALAGGTLLTLTTAPQAVLPLVAPQSQVQVTVTQHGVLTPLTVYSDESTGAVLTQPVLTTFDGVIPGFLDIPTISTTGADLQVALPGGTETVTLIAPAMIGGTLTKAAIVATGLAPGDINAAPLASPALTGTPTAPTPTNGDNSTKVATTAFVDTALAGGASVIENVHTVATSGATQTIPDVTTATENIITLTANCTFTFPTAVAGKSFLLALVQDATGSRTATWPGTVKWAGGVAPALTTAATKTDLLTFSCLDGTNWLGALAGANF